MIFKALSCDSVPHYTSIAGFVSGCPDEIEALFEQVLLICDAQGLLGHELLAIDTLDHAHVRIDAFLKVASPRRGQGKRVQEVKSNITDNESAKMTTSKGTIQTTHSTRPPTATSETKTRDVIPASEFTFDPIKKTCTCPAGETMWLRSERIDQHGHAKLFFEGRLTKCRACHRKHDYLRNPDSPNTRKGHGRQVSFIVERAARAPNYTDWMKHRVDSAQGKHIYSQRMSVVEPVFANISSNKGLKRFSLRGRRKVQGQWRLYCVIHNIEKLKNYGELARGCGTR